MLRAGTWSGYVLEADGELHPFGGAPDLESGVRVANARDVILRPDARSGWIVAASGIAPFGGAPPVSGGLAVPGAARAGTGR